MIVNELIITGRYYRVLIDKTKKLWQRISYWTHSTDVEFEDGKNAEEKLGAINGITSNVELENEDMAASIKAVHQINSNLANISIYVDDNGNLHFKNSEGADSVLPFSAGRNITTQHSHFILSSWIGHPPNPSSLYKYSSFAVKKGKISVVTINKPFKENLLLPQISAPTVVCNGTTYNLKEVFRINGNWGNENGNPDYACSIRVGTFEVKYDQTIKVQATSTGSGMASSEYIISEVTNIY